jgi:hypothetical protein
MNLCWRCGAPIQTNRIPTILLSAAGLLAGLIIGAGVMNYTNLGLRTPEPAAAAKRIATTDLTEAKAIATGWQKVAGWTGSGTKRTERFPIASAQWRIKWTTTAGQAGCVFQMYVRNDSNEAVGLPTSAAGDASDFTYMRTPPGEYSLDIASANCTWTVDVEDWR